MPGSQKDVLNVDVVTEDEQLVITIDLRMKPVESKSGKSLLLASTRGNLIIPTQIGNVRLGLNLYQYQSERAEK